MAVVSSAPESARLLRLAHTSFHSPPIHDMQVEAVKFSESVLQLTILSSKLLLPGRRHAKALASAGPSIPGQGETHDFLPLALSSKQLSRNVVVGSML